MPDSDLQLIHFKIRGLEYVETASRDEKLAMGVQIRVQYGVPKAGASPERTLRIDVVFSNEGDKKDPLKLSIQTVAVFVVPAAMPEEAVEQLMGTRGFEMAYGELSERVRIINNQIGMPDMKLPEFQDLDH